MSTKKQPLTFVLPSSPARMAWRPVFDTLGSGRPVLLEIGGRDRKSVEATIHNRAQFREFYVQVRKQTSGALLVTSRPW